MVLSPLGRKGARIVTTAALLGLGVVAIATAVAAAPLGGLSSASALAIRALIFLLLVLLVLRVSPRELVGLARRPEPVTAIVGPLTLLPFVAVLRPPLPARLVWPVLVAAAVEEIVYRVLLPERVQQRGRDSNIGWPVLWAVVLVAQVAFAMSHAAAGVAFHARIGWPSMVNLVSAGCLLAGVRILFGLPTAIGLHTLGNLTIASRALDWSSTSNGVMVAICAASLAHLALTVRSHAVIPVSASVADSRGTVGASSSAGG